MYITFFALSMNDLMLIFPPKFLQLDLQQVDDDIDWWSKFYASMGQWEKCLKYKELGYDTLVVSREQTAYKL